jgi:hypothetical protein
MPKETAAPMDIAADQFDHVELWKYFESRGSQVKETMIQVTTWILGFAGVILGFIVKETVTISGDRIAVTNPTAMMALSLVGLLVMGYAFVILWDFADHINQIFDRADRARATNRSLLQVLTLGVHERPSKSSVPKICRQIAWVLAALALFFVLSVTAALAALV